MGRGFNLCRPAKTDVGYSDIDDEDVDYKLVEGLNLRQPTKNSSLLGTYKSVGRFLFGPSTNISRGPHSPSMQRKYKTRDHCCLQLIREIESFDCDQLPFKEKHKLSSSSIGAWEDS